MIHPIATPSTRGDSECSKECGQKRKFPEDPGKDEIVKEISWRDDIFSDSEEDDASSHEHQGIFEKDTDINTGHIIEKENGSPDTKLRCIDRSKTEEMIEKSAAALDALDSSPSDRTNILSFQKLT